MDKDIDSFFVPLDEETDIFTFPFAEWLQAHQDEDVEATTSSEADSTSAMPADHPKIPGVDFSDPEAIKSCPFLSSKKTEETAAPVHPPSDHPTIPGVDFSDPEAMKACPFLSAKKTEPAMSAPVVTEAPKSNGTMPSDHPRIPGVDFSDPEAIKACPFLSAKSRE